MNSYRGQEYIKDFAKESDSTVLWLLGQLCIVNCKLESGLSDNGAGLVILDLAWAHTQPLCCKDHPSQLYFSDFYCTQPRSEITGLVPALPWSDWLLLDLLLVQVSVFLHCHRPAKSETQYLAGRCCPLVSRIQSSCYHRRSWKYSQWPIGCHEHISKPVFSRVLRYTAQWPPEWVIGVRWPESLCQSDSQHWVRHLSSSPGPG